MTRDPKQTGTVDPSIHEATPASELSSEPTPREAWLRCALSRSLTLLLMLGCTEPDRTAVGPEISYEPEGEGFFDTPWPANWRYDDDGTLSLEEFPNPHGVDLLADYLARGENQVGSGTSAPIYVRLDRLVEPELMPSPEESMGPYSSMRLVDIDPLSPHWGEQFPLQWRQQPNETSYQPEFLLAVAPLAGFPLRGSTKYALILTTDGFRRTEASAAPLEADHPHYDADLDHFLALDGLNHEHVAGVTVFSTSDPLDEMRRIAELIRYRLASPNLDKQLEFVSQREGYKAFRTHYPSPRFTFGDRPYLTEGGGFRFESDGTPKISAWDDMRLRVCTPNGLDSPPPTGWPVVIYQHGTGGSYRSFCNSDSVRETARRFGESGIIGVGIDQPLHGTRNDGAATASDIAHFNVVNPDSGASNFRQGAADALYLARALASQDVVMRDHEGRAIPLDRNRVMFMGHSQGGLTGAIAAPFFGPDVKAQMISGAGGVLAITLVERKDILDFADLLGSLFQFDEGEEFTVYHPAVGMIQTLVEVTDPVNYAPYWFSEQPKGSGFAPVPTLLTNGTLDANTPFRTAVALAAAARLPIAGDLATSGEALRLRGMMPADLPLSGHAMAYDGDPITSGFAQYWEGSHFVVFEEQHASDLVTNFFRSTADGVPSLHAEDDPR